MLSGLPALERFRELLWIKAAIKGIGLRTTFRLAQVTSLR
jgi:hypothetical protein